MNDFPNDFRDQVTAGKSTSPISASNLMQNFAWAKLIADDSLIEATTQLGFPARKLKIPAINSDGNRVLASTGGALSWKEDIPTPPTTGTHVLAAVNGALTWLATEACLV